MTIAEEVPGDQSEAKELSPRERNVGLYGLIWDVLKCVTPCSYASWGFEGPWPWILNQLEQPGFSDSEIRARLREEVDGFALLFPDDPRPDEDYLDDIRSELYRAMKDGRVPAKATGLRRRVLRHLAYGEPISRKTKTDQCVEFFDQLLKEEPNISAREAQSRAYREVGASYKIVEFAWKVASP